MSLEQQIGALVKASENLTGAVNGKIGEIDKKVDEAVNSVPKAIKDNFTEKTVSIDPINGNDDSTKGPYLTIRAAVESVPDGGTIVIKLPYGTEKKIFNFNQPVAIGTRIVHIVGGYSDMKNNGYLPAVLKPLKYFNAKYTRTQYAGCFSGEPGSRVYFRYCQIELPRIVADSSIEHSGVGAFISGGCTVTFHNFTISEPGIYVEEGSTEPLPFLRSSARDGKSNIQDFSLSYVLVETALAKALFEMQYGTGTIRFSQYACTVRDKNGASIEMKGLFAGLSYGTHGYATNILASNDIVKRSE